MKKRAMKKWIPKGMYCYNYTKSKPVNCKWLDFSNNHHWQEKGYCKYLNVGDWCENGTTLLWDECKECGEHNGLKLEKQNEIKSAKRYARLNKNKLEIK